MYYIWGLGYSGFKKKRERYEQIMRFIWGGREEEGVEMK